MSSIQFTLAITTALFSSLAFSGPGHDSDHGDENSPSFAGGKPGDQASIDQTIQVEASDRMSFNPDDWTVEPGETIRFVITNTGQVQHEFVIDTPSGNADHRKAMMEAMANGNGMNHDDPNAVSLDPGETEELVWTFSKKGTFEAACNISGHYQAGMLAVIDVTDQDTARN